MYAWTSCSRWRMLVAPLSPSFHDAGMQLNYGDCCELMSQARRQVGRSVQRGNVKEGESVCVYKRELRQQSRWWREKDEGGSRAPLGAKNASSHHGCASVGGYLFSFFCLAAFVIFRRSTRRRKLVPRRDSSSASAPSRQVSGI